MYIDCHEKSWICPAGRWIFWTAFARRFNLRKNDEFLSLLLMRRRRIPRWRVRRVTVLKMAAVYTASQRASVWIEKVEIADGARCWKMRGNSASVKIRRFSVRSEHNGKVTGPGYWKWIEVLDERCERHGGSSKNQYWFPKRGSTAALWLQWRQKGATAYV